MLSRYYRTVSIAGIVIRLETDWPLAVEDNFLPFLTDGAVPDFRVDFHRVAVLPPIPDATLHTDLGYNVHPDGNGSYLRSFFDAPRDMTPYALAAYDYPHGSIQIEYLEKGFCCISQMRSGFFHLGLESLLIHRNRLCLHAACIRTHLGGILFSGPSGIGKSTQAALWEAYRGARLINGDRPILSRDAGGWLAWGSPYAGSSRCHINESCPITAIVMLRQAQKCRLRRLTQPEAFRAIWSGLTVCSWDRMFVEVASRLAMELSASVPVLEFACTPDRQAVDTLEQGLRKECCL